MIRRVLLAVLVAAGMIIAPTGLAQAASDNGVFCKDKDAEGPYYSKDSVWGQGEITCEGVREATLVGRLYINVGGEWLRIERDEEHVGYHGGRMIVVVRHKCDDNNAINEFKFVLTVEAHPWVPGTQPEKHRGEWEANLPCY